jgi:YHS domain-containing protein
MKTLQAGLFAALFGTAALSFAADKPSGQTSAKTDGAGQSESEIIAKARDSYPLKTCLVSDEAITNLGEATPHIHRQSGKPDRVVFFCCEGCLDDFKKEPAKFLAKVDAAAAARNKKK